VIPVSTTSRTEKAEFDDDIDVNHEPRVQSITVKRSIVRENCRENEREIESEIEETMSPHESNDGGRE
jgi:hypothetical protein